MQRMPDGDHVFWHTFSAHGQTSSRFSFPSGNVLSSPISLSLFRAILSSVLSYSPVMFSSSSSSSTSSSSSSLLTSGGSFCPLTLALTLTLLSLSERVCHAMAPPHETPGPTPQPSTAPSSRPCGPNSSQFHSIPLFAG